MTKPQSNFELARINAEGELTGGVFCEYCGGLNRTEAAECEHCQKHIADQGPDLRSRLQRIHRIASSSQGFSDISDGGIGTVPPENKRRLFGIPLGAISRRSIERGAVLATTFFLLCMVALLTRPSREMVFIVLFFATAALSCTVVSRMINVQEQSANQREDRNTNDSPADLSVGVGWDATRLIACLASVIFSNNR
jgi:hypothetical protein